MTPKSANVVAIGILLSKLLGLAVHIMTVVAAYKVSGIVAAIVAFCLPIGAEVYWIGYFWFHGAPLFTFYTSLAFIDVIAFVGFSLLLSRITDATP